jgi:hypothetical protein
MPPIDAVPAAAGAFQRIADSEQGERARRAAAGALVLRAVGMAAAGETGAPFALRRAHAEEDTLPRSAESSILRRLLAAADLGVDAGLLAPALVSYACELERTHRLPEADAAVSLARELAPGDAATALHAGRIARRAGEAGRALGLYREARRLDGADGAITRLASVGEAVVSPSAQRELGRAIRAALRAGDSDAAAVGLEERARVRRAAGDRGGAMRDLAIAAARFAGAVDRARVAHELAGAALAAGDPLAAREALSAAVAWGDGEQQDHARSRLHTLSRDLGDQVGMRRWRASKRPALVSLSAYRPRPTARSAASRLARGREALA